jgi:hypothetical protein
MYVLTVGHSFVVDLVEIVVTPAWFHTIAFVYPRCPVSHQPVVCVSAIRKDQGAIQGAILPTPPTPSTFKSGLTFHHYDGQS